MSLDLFNTATQVQNMVTELKLGQQERQRRLESSLYAIREFPFDNNKLSITDLGPNEWGVPEALELPSTAVTTPKLPPDFTVISVDGSQIDPDRHLAARCFLINIGAAVLEYGSEPGADLFSRPRLYAGPSDLVIKDPITSREQVIEGAVLGAKRMVEEIRILLDVVMKSPHQTPTLALIDGSLLMLGLIGRGYDDFVRKHLVEEGFVEALGQLRRLSQERLLAVAAYTSLPRHFEVVNALRSVVCNNPEIPCGPTKTDRQICDRCVGGILDREVFALLLKPSERSGLFMTSSPFVESHYNGNRICFFYLNIGEEICRVEVPSWVAENENLLNLVHTLVVDQCRLGRGYPVGLMEAHEQAVVTGSDRQIFINLVERILHDENLPVFTSEKDRSKRLRWL